MARPHQQVPPHRADDIVDAGKAEQQGQLADANRRQASKRLAPPRKRQPNNDQQDKNQKATPHFTVASKERGVCPYF